MNKNIFNSVQVSAPQGNIFDLSHDLKCTINMGRLYPTACLECVPGDHFTISFENMLRFAPLLAPVMHKVRVTTHYFFVPNRLTWSNWEDYITGNSETAVHPTISPALYDPEQPRVNAVGSIADFFGIPPFTIPVGYDAPEFNAFPFAAVAKIWLDYYMDQNNVDPSVTGYIETLANLVDGDNTNLDTDYLNFSPVQYPRAWRHDYFTSALPFAQKGDPVSIPIADFNDVPIVFDDTNSYARIVGSSTPAGAGSVDVGTGGLIGQGSNNIWFDLDAVAQTSTLTAGSATINNLRRAFRLQEWLEKNARGGTRYTESIKMHFGVNSSDARLQRAEYIGGSVQNVVISEVLTTAETVEESLVVNPVGNMQGHGISVGGSHKMKYYCEEHGFIIGLISVMPEPAYQDGIPRKFIKPDKFAYYWPTFANIGEQEVYNMEVYYDPTDLIQYNEGVFGYVPRYSEYKYEPNRIAGSFRDTLDYWHFGRQFAGPVALNHQFIYSDPSTFRRPFAVQSGDDTIYCHILNSIKAFRKMPKYGTPML